MDSKITCGRGYSNRTRGSSWNIEGENRSIIIGITLNIFEIDVRRHMTCQLGRDVKPRPVDGHHAVGWRGQCDRSRTTTRRRLNRGVLGRLQAVAVGDNQSDVIGLAVRWIGY